MPSVLSSKLFLLVSLVRLSLSILVVYLVKFAYINYDFPIVGLTYLQLIFAFVGCVAGVYLGLIQHKRLPCRDIFISSLCFTGFFLFTNLSWDINSLQVAQQMSFIQIPLFLAIQLFLNKQNCSMKLKLISVIICVPIGLSTFDASDFEYSGVMFGLFSAVFGAVNSWWLTNNNQTAMQCLIYQTPFAAAISLAISLLTEDNFNEFGLFSSTRPPLEWVPIVLIFTCILSTVHQFLIHYSIDAGFSNSLVVNNLINVIIFVVTGIVGAFEFYDSFGTMQIVSTVIVSIGVILYSLIHVHENNGEKPKPSLI